MNRSIWLAGLFLAAFLSAPADAGEAPGAIEQEIEDYAEGTPAWQQVASLEPGSVVIYPEDDSFTMPSLGSWNLVAAPSLWLPGLSGDLGIKGGEADVESSLGDADAPYGIQLEFWDGNWGSWLSLQHIEVEAERNGKRTDAEATVEEFIIEAAAAYRIDLGRGWIVEPYAGLRLRCMDLDLDIEEEDQTPFSRAGDELWLDPVVGARARVRVNDWLSVRIRGDFGGFGVGADSTWNLSLGADIHVTDWLSAALGWRLLDTDYEDGTGNDRFKFDARYSGPYLGLIFSF